MKNGDLVRFQHPGQFLGRVSGRPVQHMYWTIGLCLSYDPVQGIVKILYKGKIISKQKWSVEKAGAKDVQFRRLIETG